MSRRLLTCLALTTAIVSLTAPSAQAAFGLGPGPAGFSAVATQDGGAAAAQAASHPQVLRTEVNFNLGPESPGESGVPFTEGDVKSLQLDLPPGLVENPAAVPQCSLAAFHTPRTSPFEEDPLTGESCPDRTQIGTVEVRSSYGGGTTRTFGVFNLVPPPGAPSELGFNPYGAPITFIPHVRQAEGEYGLSLLAQNISQQVDLYGFTLTSGATPGAHPQRPARQLPERGRTLPSAGPNARSGHPRLNPATAYLTLPTSCAGPLAFTATATSWQEPAVSASAAPTRDQQPDGLQARHRLRTEPDRVRHRSARLLARGFDFNLTSTTPASLLRVDWRRRRRRRRWSACRRG